MKYLKLFEDSEDDDEQIIREICYDITDDYRYSINVGSFDMPDYELKIYDLIYNCRYVYIVDKYGAQINYIHETIQRICNYLGDRFIHFSFLNDRHLINTKEIPTKIGSTYIFIWFDYKK